MEPAPTRLLRGGGREREFFFGEQALETIRRRFELGLVSVAAGVFEGAAAASQGVGGRGEESGAEGGSWGVAGSGGLVAVVEVCVEVFAFLAVVPVGLAEGGAAGAVAEVSGLAFFPAIVVAVRGGCAVGVGIGGGGGGVVVDAVEAWVEEQGIAVGEVELLFVAEEVLAFFGKRGGEARADGGGQGAVFLACLVEKLRGLRVEGGEGGRVRVLVVTCVSCRTERMRIG